MKRIFASGARHHRRVARRDPITAFPRSNREAFARALLGEPSARAAARKRREASGRERVGTCIAVIYKFEGRRLTLPDADRQACHLVGFITVVLGRDRPRNAVPIGSGPRLLLGAFRRQPPPTSAATLKRIKPPAAAAVAPITQRGDDSWDTANLEFASRFVVFCALASHTASVLPWNADFEDSFTYGFSSRDILSYFSSFRRRIVDGNA